MAVRHWAQTSTLQYNMLMLLILRRCWILNHTMSGMLMWILNRPREVEQCTIQFDTVNHRLVKGTQEGYEFLV